VRVNPPERRSKVMSNDPPESDVGHEAEASAARELSPAAQRALREAEARRAEAKVVPPAEFHGRGGLDPARYGDWEVKGLASDF
jgi:hypothetical protein